MDNLIALICAGFIVGAAGTLIGAGGGFILVPLLILTHPEYSPEIVTAISIAIVASNATSGSIAYSSSGRIDYKAGIEKRSSQFLTNIFCNRLHKIPLGRYLL